MCVSTCVSIRCRIVRCLIFTVVLQTNDFHGFTCMRAGTRIVFSAPAAIGIYPAEEAPSLDLLASPDVACMTWTSSTLAMMLAWTCNPVLISLTCMLISLFMKLMPTSLNNPPPSGPTGFPPVPHFLPPVFSTAGYPVSTSPCSSGCASGSVGPPAPTYKRMRTSEGTWVWVE